jgi:hypothetical protein
MSTAATTKCWTLGDRFGNFPTLAVQFARLRGFEVDFWSIDVGRAPAAPARSGHLVALRFDLLRNAEEPLRRWLRESLNAGAILYVRGGLETETSCPLAPVADVNLRVARQRRAGCYRFTEHPLLPAAIRNEQAEGCFVLAGAEGLPDNARPLLVTRHFDGANRASIFAIELGRGCAIFDLSPQAGFDQGPIVQRLAEPASRAVNAGALVAADRAAGRDPERPSALGIVIDDRPANFDYFNSTNIEQLLRHLQTRLSDVHVDFAWIPDQTRPSHRYVETLKRFNAGFVWHGFLHHVDHRRVRDPAADFERGARLVAEIGRRYRVRFQPVMIFPFEKDSAETDEVLKRGGFLAKAISLGPNPSFEHQVPHYAYRSRPRRRNNGVAVLYRDSLHELTRERMLAHAALGLPVISVAHPADLALRRFSFLPGVGSGTPDHFDPVLDFASEKGLRPKSLEEIAVEQNG